MVATSFTPASMSKTKTLSYSLLKEEVGMYIFNEDIRKSFQIDNTGNVNKLAKVEIFLK